MIPKATVERMAAKIGNVMKLRIYFPQYKILLLRGSEFILGVFKGMSKRGDGAES